jgi:peptide chain release factor subunit 1
MITYLNIEDLLDFSAKKQPIISFYLNVDGALLSHDQQKVVAKNLLREGRKSLEANTYDTEVRSLLQTDLDRIDKYLTDELAPGLNYRGLAIFACSEAGLWRVFSLPRPVPSSLFIENSPHVRPLTLILDEYHRYGVLLIDKAQAELYDVYIGEIVKVENAFTPTAKGVVPVEGPGSADRGQSRHVEEEFQKHFRHAADVLFHQFHRRHYEYVVLGGQQQLLVQFENYLHPTLMENVVGRFAAEPGKTRTAKILDEVSAIERKVEIAEEKVLVKKMVNTALGRGLAVLGIDSVLTALQVGAVHMLVVEDGWHTQGSICRNCGFFGVALETCPGCKKEMTQATDMVDEVILSAIKTGSLIEHVNPQEAGLAEHGHIGAILRFHI